MSERGRVVFHDVWKRFNRGERLDSLRDLVPAAVRRLLGQSRSLEGREEGAFWALRDVSFEASEGRVVGLIGPNGAGKSTILKLVAGILEPDRGSIDVVGRLGALIEIAAGFHMDLTGRENVYLQGAVMGMTREEIESRFETIVDFAGVTEFIDTPVKRYSSGMNARLGFSIAAHLNPDVLLIDEVLSVGDISFQRRAVERLEEIVARDIPVIIVSHKLERITRLCDEVLLLAGGKVVRHGTPLECVSAYVEGEHLDAGDRPNSGWIDTEDRGTVSGRTLRSGERIEFTVRGRVPSPDVVVGVRVRTVPDGSTLFAVHSGTFGIELDADRDFRIQVALEMNVGPGLYGLQPTLWQPERRQELGRAGMVFVEVKRDRSSFGQVELNPRMRCVEP